MFRVRRPRVATASTVVVVLVVVLVCGTGSRAAARDADDAPVVEYQAPVDAPVRDPFRAPAGPYAPGNRGIEYDTGRGVAVLAAADGTVAFAGVVARQQWVTLTHADGLRTTVGPLAEVIVVAGDLVHRGDPVGRSGGAVLFTVRRGDDYLDPASVIAATPTVRLLADERPSETPRRNSIVTLSAGVLRQLLDLAPPLGPPIALPVRVLAGAATAARTFATGAAAWWRGRDDCTSAGVQPVAPAGPRRAVLVGGLGSSSEQAAIDRLDLAALGYEAVDAVRFSYAGPGAAYAAADTLGDVVDAGERLAQLLIELAGAGASEPPVPIDVYAHSQGGVLARIAVARLAATHPDVLARLGVVVTFGTPHHGAPLAGSVSALARHPVTWLVLEGVQELAGTGIEPDATAIRQLAPGSPVLTALAATPLPTGPRYLSIAGWADIAVPPARARLDGATNVVVGVPGLDDHALLPGAPAALREVALVRAGLPPACTSARRGLGGWALAAAVEGAEQAIGG